MSNAVTDWPVGKLIGFGQSWSTYEDPTDPEKVIKISQIPVPDAGAYTHSEIVRNLMHLVIPENIPQIFQVGLRSDDTRQVRMQRIPFHDEYARLIYLKNTGVLTEQERTELHDAFEAHSKWVETDPKCVQLFATFEEFGIATIKDLRVNVVQTPDCTPVYIDDMLLDMPIDEFAQKLYSRVDESQREVAQKLVEEYKNILTPVNQY
jgi:hypothetical protein